MSAVTYWLDTNGVSYAVRGISRVNVRTTASHHADTSSSSRQGNIHHDLLWRFRLRLFHSRPVREGSRGPFKTREIFTLNGKITKEGGEVKCVNANGTYPQTSLTFGPAGKPEKGMPIFRSVAGTFGGKALNGQAIFEDPYVGQPVACVNLDWRVPGTGESIWERGSNPPLPPPPGRCILYKTVDSKPSANSSTFSGFATKQKVALWPSWPASSPWITAVGATRFIGQKAGNAEMASDQFGSGGGFSFQFDQTNAAWQAKATAKYLSTADQSTLPPAGSYPAKGRGTPDVSALGE